ncbi:MAG: FtsX-like permease family protein [Pseudomonadales bacterium]
MTTRLAWRNLWRHGRRTWLTVGAMIFCNALLVFMIAFQFGTYGLMIDSSLSVLTGHIQIQQKDYQAESRMRYSIPAGVDLAARLREQSGIQHIAARTTAFALASSEERSFGIQVYGVDPEREPDVSTIPGLIKTGRYLLDQDAAEIVIGSVLARNLKLTVGDELTLLGSGRDGSFAAGIVTVVGILESGLSELDRSIAQIPLAYFQSVFSMGDHVHSIVVHLDALGAVAPVKQRLVGLVQQPELVVLDWDELQPGLRQAIQADMFSAFVMYAVLIVLVAFSVLNTQLMSVLERTREFGVMMALGFSPGGLARLVFLETAVMSLLGLTIGCLLGASIAYYFQVFGLHIPALKEAMDQYNLPAEIYPQVNLISVFVGPGVVFLGSMLAAVYPALRLHTLEPVAAMRAV